MIAINDIDYLCSRKPPIIFDTGGYQALRIDLNSKSWLKCCNPGYHIKPHKFLWIINHNKTQTGAISELIAN